MRLLNSTIHSDLSPQNIDCPSFSRFTRKAARAIVLQHDNILLLYTERYQDYSLPGGGIDEGESQVDGLVRELREETGAQNPRNFRFFGVYEEYRPWYKNDFDMVHMLSYCYQCDIDKTLLAPQLESYEKSNGMRPVWMNIFDAIAHNESTIAASDKKGLSIERETFLLKKIAEELMPCLYKVTHCIAKKPVS